MWLQFVFARQILIRFWGAFLGGAIIYRGCGFLFYVDIAFVPEAGQKKLEPMPIILNTILLHC